MFGVQVGRIGLLPLVATWIAVSSIFATSSRAGERPGVRHSVEFALLPSVTWVSRPIVYSFDNPSVVQEHTTAVTFPAVAPGVRLTFWGRSIFIFDFGLTYLSTNGETDVVLEGGPGFDLASADAKFRPFAGGLCGLLVKVESMLDQGRTGDTEGYIGGQAGVRYFVREYAATRLQIGYRRTMGDKFKLRALEIAGGIGFFL